MQIFAFLSLLATVIYLRLGSQVYNADRKARLNRLFLALSLSLAVWSFGYIFVYFNYNEAAAQFWFWNKFSAFGWATYSGIALHLSLELTCKDRFIRNSWAYILLYGPGVVALAAELVIFGPGYHPLFAANLFALLFGLYYGTCIAASLILVWWWGRKASLQREKKQARLILLTGLISFGSGYIVQTILPLFGVQEIPSSAQILALVWAFGVSKAITKYKFLNLSALVSAEQILEEVTDLLFLLDMEQNITRVNRQTEEVLCFNSHELQGKPFSKLMAIHFLQVGKEPEKIEVELTTKTGDAIPALLNITTVRDVMGDPAGLLLIGQDMRNIKKMEYLSFHDPLTGLFNRVFFEREMESLENQTDEPLGILLSDIDGLKLINDTFGHAAGDKLIQAGGRAMERAVGSLGIVARVGGDEFAVLVKGTGEIQMVEIYKKINNEVVAFNEGNLELTLSLSSGYAYSKGDVNIRELFKEADDKMYREKLFKNNSIRSSIIRTLTETLQARDYITGGHAERLQDIVESMGKAIQLPESTQKDLRLFAQFHDIGKVGIPDRILFKSGPLTLEEKKVMQRHSEIGYRIAMSSPELMPIADWILKHHEWWDGSGYPIGLKMGDIPVACRILSIADAFDAMTNDRPYRLAMSEEKAAAELMNGAGTQFDPTLVRIFLASFLKQAEALRQNV